MLYVTDVCGGKSYKMQFLLGGIIMNTIFIYANQYKNDIHTWLLTNSITPSRYYHSTWTTFNSCINDICKMIAFLKPEQIIFEEHSEYEDSVWDAITSKCDKLNIEIDRNGKIKYLVKS